MQNLFDSVSSEESISYIDNYNDNNRRFKLTFSSFLFIIFILIGSLTLIELFIVLYFSFCGLVFLTINLFIYEWLSLFTKDLINLIFSILANFSDFGLFYALSLFSIQLIKFYIMIFRFFFKKIGLHLKKKTSVDGSCENICDELLTFLKYFIPTAVLFILLFFSIYKWLFYVSISFELLLLTLFVFIFLQNCIVKNFDQLKTRYQVENNLINFEKNTEINDNNENKEINNNNESTENISDNNNSENELDENPFEIDDDISGMNIDTNNTIYNIDLGIIGFNENFIINETIEEEINFDDIIRFYNQKSLNINNKIEKYRKIFYCISDYIKKINDNIDNLNNNKIKKIEKKINNILLKIEELIYDFLITAPIDEEIYINLNIYKINKFNKYIKIINCYIGNDFINDINEIITKLKKHFDDVKDLNYQNNISSFNQNSDDIETIIDKLNFKQSFAEDYIYKINKIITVIKNKYVDDNIWLTSIMEIFFYTEGMFNTIYIQMEKRFKSFSFYQYLIYRIIICIIISGLQLYSILYPYLRGSFSIGEFFAFFFVKLFFIERICAYNFIDIIIYWRARIKEFFYKSHKIVFYVVVVLYIVTFIIIVVILCVLSNLTIFPTINNALYIKNNEPWLKYKNLTLTPEGFCFAQSENDGSLKTVDFAMLTTLPRLYGITKEGKCYIKPSMRGLFNTTMKYIFGRNYENDNIQIICKKLTHNIYLIITSDKILNQTIENLSNKKIKILDKQFNITNTNYFENFSSEKLTENGKQLFDDYEKCVSENGTENCEIEWDIFTQYYWTNIHTNEYENISGFERYQINIDSNLIIQPSFVTEDNNFFSGTHYIVGGSYEDAWSFGFFIETVGRNYIPLIIENFLPMYSFVRNIANDIFIRIEWINKHIFYIEDFSTKELKSLSKLYNQFNFSHQNIYTIGHTISGTVLKVFSFFADVKGIVFESSDGKNNMNFLDHSHLNKLSKYDSQITNVYSDGTLITSNDEKCSVSGVLPKRYILPSVYDTACLTAISCSNTLKYVPFCKQVLNQNKKNPLKEFNISFEAYLRHYGLLPN